MKRHYEYRADCQPGGRRSDKVFFGLIVLGIGILLMLKKLGVFFFAWHTFWPVILIAIGLGIGIKKNFRNNAWWILTLIGVAHLVPEFEVVAGVWSSSLMIPLAVIILGLFIVFRSGKKKRGMNMDKFEVVTNNENELNIDVTFGGRKEIVTSKNFKGGNISTTFGGCEVNMIQADSTEQPMILNIKVSFGGVELIVPSHWELQNEIDSTVGSVEDHRTLRTGQSQNEEKKILILRGSCSFGSIEIKSY